MRGKIVLIPITLGESDLSKVIPHEVQLVTKSLKYFIVENERTARRYLKQVDKSINIDELTFFLMDKHTKEEEFYKYLFPIEKGEDIGIMSESGCPGIADPGSEVVRLAHLKGIRVEPMVGPSSILLALISSGMNGQNFAFNGYLPIDSADRSRAIKNLELRSKKEKQTQIFIETPFRNDKFFDELLKNCSPTTRICTAVDITLATEFIKTATVAEWKKSIPQLNKRYAIFLFQA